MQKLFRIAALCIIPLISCCAGDSFCERNRTPPPRSDRKLLWSEEFDKPGKPDPGVWTYETGFVRNREAQYYTDRPENIRVENGCLVIEGRKERLRNPNADAKNPAQPDYAQYTSAAAITQGLRTFHYGRIEVRAKIPVATGSWPAIWLLGANRPEVRWPKCGEIDIMEAVGKSPKNIYATVHYAGENGKRKQRGGKISDVTPGDDFHLYALEWTPEKLDFFYDGKLYYTFRLDDVPPVNGKNPFHQPAYLLLNLAIGGSWGGPKIDDSAMPWRYEIDFVRYYAPRINSAEPR